MMKNYDQSVEIIHNPNWSDISDHPYRTLNVHGSRSGRTNMLQNLVKHQRPDVDKIYLNIKDPFKSMYQLLINGRVKVETENFKNPKTFIDY